MNRPGFRTLLLGSRLTAPPIMLACVYVTYRWWETGGHGILGFLMIGLFLACARAVGVVAAYRRWRADWGAMSPGGQRRGWRPRPAMIVSTLGVAAVGIGMVWALGPGAPGQVHDTIGPASAVCALLTLALFLGRGLWRLRSGQRQGTRPSVAIAISGPVLRVPSIAGCYRRLPSYCQQLLQGRL